MDRLLYSLFTFSFRLALTKLFSWNLKDWKPVNNQWLTGSILLLAMGGAAACGSSDASTGSGGNGNTANGGDTGSGGSAAGSGPTGGGAGGNAAGGTHNGSGGTGSGGTSAGGTGAGGTSSGGTSAGGTDAGGSAGTSGAGGSTSIPPATFPLLVVTTSDKVKVWQHADLVKDGDAPSFELTIELGAKGSISGVVATRERLGVVSSAGLSLFDALGTLSASSKAAALIPAKAFSASPDGDAFNHQFVDAAGDLWLTYGPGRIALLKGFNTLTSSSKPAAEFSHQWEQLASAAYYAPADLLFGAQVSGAGVLYYSHAKTKTGVVSAPDGTFNSFSGWQSAVLGNSLFVGGNELDVWHGLDTKHNSRAPDAKLGGSGLYLDASANAIATATADGGVSYFALASSLTSDNLPSAIHVAPALHGIDLSNDAQTLATVGSDKVYLIAHGASGLSVRAALPLGDKPGNDVALVE